MGDSPSTEPDPDATTDAPAPPPIVDAAADAEATESAASEEQPAQGRADSGGSAVIAVLGMMLLVLSGLVVALIAYVNTEDGPNYGVGMESDAYDLGSMALRESDTPDGLNLGDRLELDNEQWAFALDSVDPESRLPQLNAQQRVRGAISLFEWEDGFTRHLAETLALLSQSTVYETEAAAREAIAGTALCGLRLNETSPIDEFAVPKLGDESVGFFVVSSDEQVGTSVETVVCFRTGRIVHGVVQSSFDGAQDIGFVIGLAKDMLGHVEGTFDGTGTAADDDPDPET